MYALDLPFITYDGTRIGIALWCPDGTCKPDLQALTHLRQRVPLLYWDEVQGLGSPQDLVDRMQAIHG